jgi:hypothetical protein
MLKKRKRTNRLLVSHIHHQQRLLPKKKKKTKETFDKHSGDKKDPHLLPTSLFPCCCFFSSTCVVDERTSWLYNIYMCICPFAIIDWIRTDGYAYSAVYTHSLRVPVKRMLVKEWINEKKRKKETKIIDKEFQCLEVQVLCEC